LLGGGISGVVQTRKVKHGKQETWKKTCRRKWLSTWSISLDDSLMKWRHSIATSVPPAAESSD
jgi:hypothetical protein